MSATATAAPASSKAARVGLGLGGFVHIIAGALGLSALVMASANAFSVLKIAGALYLIWLGAKAWREARVAGPTEIQTTGVGRAFREGIVVEALNPKTAAFFLAFIPQFVDPSANVAAQFVVLGFGNPPKPAARLSCMCSRLPVAGITQVIAGSAKTYLRNS